MKKLWWKKVCFGMIGILVLGLLICKMNHEIRLKQEKKVLEYYGVGERINVGGKKINLYTAGDEDATSTIVYMHGLGMGDTTIAARPMLKSIADNHKICIIDRHGNGMSDDTNENQTVDCIINEYRNTLKNGGQEAPYILIAHSISGIYATYWAQNYPQEVNAIIYLDADPVECFEKEGKVDLFTLLLSKAEMIASEIGLQRFFVSDSTMIGETEHQVYTKKQNELRKYLIYRNTYSKATCSELELYYENAKTVLENNMNFEIPQLYIVSNNMEGEYYEIVYSNTLEERYHGDPIKIQEVVDLQQQIMNEKKEYMKQRNNIDIVEIPGPHCLYEYNPNGVAKVINDFLTDKIK